MKKRGLICLIVGLVLVNFVVLSLDITSPVIKLDTSLPDNITSNITILLSASFSDDIGFVEDIILNKLSDSSKAKNLTFVSNQTVYLKIPKNANVINAMITLSGYGKNYTQEDPTSYGFDTQGYYFINYTIPRGANTSSKWKNKVGRREDDCHFTIQEMTINQSCWDWALANNRILEFRLLMGQENCWNGTWVTMRTYSTRCVSGGLTNCPDMRENSFDGNWDTYSVPFSGRFCGYPAPGSLIWTHGNNFWEDAMLWENALYYNPYLEVGIIDGIKEWTHSGEFSTTETTPDFSAEINEYLNMCTVDVEGNCLVPLSFYLDSVGVIELSNINITYQVNQPCELCISSDPACDTEWISNNVTTTLSKDYKSGSCSYSWDTSNYADNFYNIRFRIKDIAYNTGTSFKQIILDRTAPVFLYHYYPIDNSIFKTNNTNPRNISINLLFVYYISELSPTFDCSLILNSKINQTGISLQKNSWERFKLNLSKPIEGTYYYNWSIKCMDVFGFESSTDTRRFTLNVIGNLPGVTCTDNDGDGYNVTGGTCGTADCNDNNAKIYPGATEVCNDRIDNDCDGLIDRADPDCVFPTITSLGDIDGDGINDTMTNTGVNSGYGNMNISGNIIALTSLENSWSVDEDLNNDGDKEDNILRYYDINTGILTNTGVSFSRYGTSMRISGNIIALTTLESPWSIDEDLNGDGDKDDTILRYYDVSTGILTNTNISVGDGGMDISGNIIALVNTSGMLGYYDISTGTLTNINLSRRNNLAISGDIIALISNGLEYYDISTGTLTNTNISVGYSGHMAISGNIIVLNIGYVLTYYDISTGTLTNTNIGIGRQSPSISGNIIALKTYEGLPTSWYIGVDEDLNRDGDKDDTILRYITLSKYAAPGITCTDNDRDGYNITGGTCGIIDCNDNNAKIYPGATEICNENDNDCDGLIGRTDPDCVPPILNRGDQIFENIDYGKIAFSRTINLTGISNIVDYIKIFHNRININHTALPELNKSATIYLYNLTYRNPRVLRDGEVCPSTICRIISYSNGTLIFNITVPSNYTTEEIPLSDSIFTVLLVLVIFGIIYYFYTKKKK